MRTIYHAGEFWKMHANGEIERPGLARPSPSWRVAGAVMRNNFGYVTRRYTLADIEADPSAIPWKFKNGNQRVFVQDFDHGTYREWTCNHRIS